MTPGTRHAPVLSEALLRESIKLFVERADADTRILLLRAQPRSLGDSNLSFGERSVRVVAGVSQLAVLDAYSTLAEDEILVVLTDRVDQELGSAVLIPAERQTVQFIDDWNLVPALFGATGIDPRLRAIGSWLPAALLEHQPVNGWPAVPAGSITADFAVRALLAQVLGLRGDGELDAIMLLEQLENADARQRWVALDETMRKGLTLAASRYLGEYSALALSTVASGKSVSVVAIGLAADVLWPHALPEGELAAQIIARTRIEQYVGVDVSRTSARAYADAAVSIVLRRDAAGDPRTDQVITQAEALLRDLGWAEGAENSELLRAGLMGRLRGLAQRLSSALKTQSADGDASVEDALNLVGAHLLGHRDLAEIFSAQMAVRLLRWLRAKEADAEFDSLAEGMARYSVDGGWADRALAAVWSGSAEPTVAATYATLAEKVRGLRDAQDERAAQFLTGARLDSTLVVPVEEILSVAVQPISQSAPVLLIVLDGMSVAVATELAQDMAPLGWVELVREGSSQRLAAISALPSVTTYSRTSLFAGMLLAGQQDVEKSRFAAAVKGALFHKDDLRSGAGETLPASVTSAIASPTQRIVGVVLNTIDDALAKHDPGGTRWNLGQVQHLRALLNEAAQAGRSVILTSDHGHVIERGGEHRPVPGAGGRWRSVASGPVRPSETQVSGPRVLAPGGSAILARVEGLRYTGKAAGYHGGASLAELTIPLLVFRRQERPPVHGWVDAMPQSPVWWNDRARAIPRLVAAPPKTTATKKPLAVDAQSLFELPPADEVVQPRADLAQSVVASEIFAGQEARAGRHPLANVIVHGLLSTLVDQGGRAHKDTLAVAVGIATTAIEPTLAAFRRLLNVDGYDVVATDADGHTVVLDLPLLREQFGLELGK